MGTVTYSKATEQLRRFFFIETLDLLHKQEIKRRVFVFCCFPYGDGKLLREKIVASLADTGSFNRS